MSRCWLLKTEPSVFSFDDLWKAPKRTTNWSGVRNFQARNFMRDAMKKGDRVLIYHSNAEPPAVVGEAVVAREGYVEEGPWVQVDVKAVRKLPQPVPLETIKATRALQKMVLVNRSRLSVQPVEPAEYDLIVKLGQ